MNKLYQASDKKSIIRGNKTAPVMKHDPVLTKPVMKKGGTYK